MIPNDNPFSPLTDEPPAVFVGREELLAEIGAVYSAGSCTPRSAAFFVIGPGGCGKTAFLMEVGRRAQGDSHAVSIVACEPGRSLAEVLHPVVGKELRAYSLREDLREICEDGLAVWRDAALTPISRRMSKGSAGKHLAKQLARLFDAAGRAARAAGSFWIILIDGVHALLRYECEALLNAFARVARRKLPVCLVATGLPNAHVGLFATASARMPLRCVQLDALGPQELSQAVIRVLAAAGRNVESGAVETLVAMSRGEPLLLQALAHVVWESVADRRTWSVGDVLAAGPAAIRLLVKKVFEPQIGALTEVELNYLRAVLEVGGPEPRSREIAVLLGVSLRAAAGTRLKLVRKGLLCVPQRGTVAFASRLFAEFLQATLRLKA